MSKIQTVNGGQVDTVAVPRSALRAGDHIVVAGTVYVVREPIRWELTAPQHWVWTRRVESPELTDGQLAELTGDRAFDGTGYGFHCAGPDHIYQRVVDRGEQRGL